MCFIVWRILKFIFKRIKKLLTEDNICFFSNTVEKERVNDKDTKQTSTSRLVLFSEIFLDGIFLVVQYVWKYLTKLFMTSVMTSVLVVQCHYTYQNSFYSISIYTH